jgi:transcriptional regulator of acetoin/glycerol metabolism
MERLAQVAESLIQPLRVVEQQAIESAMILCYGNVERAAELLGLSRSTLFRRLKEYREADA